MPDRVPTPSLKPPAKREITSAGRVTSAVALHGRWEDARFVLPLRSGELRCVAVRDREPQPTFIAPMLLTSGDVPGGQAWTLEVKWDGCRAQLRYDGRAVSVRTRTGRNCTEEFPELAAIAVCWAGTG
jgi:ATP-dependent DNA ligase